MAERLETWAKVILTLGTIAGAILVVAAPVLLGNDRLTAVIFLAWGIAAFMGAAVWTAALEGLALVVRSVEPRLPL